MGNNSIPQIRAIMIDDSVYISCRDLVDVLETLKTPSNNLWHQKKQSLSKRDPKILDNIRTAVLPTKDKKWYQTEVITLYGACLICLFLRSELANKFQKLVVRAIMTGDWSDASDWLINMLVFIDPADQVYVNRREIEAGYDNPVVLFDETTEEYLYHIQNGQCVYCQKDLVDGYDVDHYMPLKPRNFELFYNPREAHNMVLACPHCNGSKNNRHPVEWIEYKFGQESVIEILERVESIRDAMMKRFYQVEDNDLLDTD